MRLPPTGICALMFICLAAPMRPLQAQTTVLPTTRLAPFTYDIGQEVILKGTVTSVLTRASAGMMPGSHLLLTTLSGPADVSLGTFGLRGKAALSVAAGQQIEVTGVMKALKNGEVFLARTVKVGAQVYAIRNEHGVPVSPQARKRASQKNTDRGQTE